MVPGIDPMIDYAFKRVFGREQNRPILIHLLNAVMQLPPQGQVVSLDILNPFNDKEGWDDKLSIVDIKARDQSGRQFDVEMELLPDRVFRPRVLYYRAKYHQQQMHEGDDYSVLRPTVSICLVDSVMFPAEPRYRQRFLLREEMSGAVFSDHMDVYLLEMPKFTLPADRLAEPLEQWLYFFRHAAQLVTTSLPTSLRIPEIGTAMEELAMLSRNDLERERYEARLRVQRDERSRLAVARAEGIEIGIEKGIEKGDPVGRVRLLQSLLGQPVTSTAELLNLPAADLQNLADALEQELRSSLRKPG